MARADCTAAMASPARRRQKAAKPAPPTGRQELAKFCHWARLLVVTVRAFAWHDRRKVDRVAVAGTWQPFVRARPTADITAETVRRQKAALLPPLRGRHVREKFCQLRRLLSVTLRLFARQERRKTAAVALPGTAQPRACAARIAAKTIVTRPLQKAARLPPLPVPPVRPPPVGRQVRA